MKKLSILFSLIFATSFGQSKPNTSNQKNEFEEQINQLVAKMSLDEKIGQTNLRGTSSRVKGEPSQTLKDAVREGKIGAMINVMNIDYVNILQKIAVEESPNKIPLIFGRDVIHGFKTIFPIPLGIAASWDAEVAKNSSRVAAIEASSFGVRWTFAPMLDIARDGRWGRIAESPGEDPYLASILGKAYVEGFQGNSLSDPTSMAACIKHFIGYGAAIGGRDYNTTEIPESLLRNIYLPPFQAAINAGAATLMTSFNEINGIPASGNKFLLKQVLREEMKFDGFVVSDWNSITEMIPHGFAQDEKHAAELAANSGLDMEMTSQSYEKHLKELINEGKFTEAQLDEFVKNILRIKFRLNLFKNPYVASNHSGNLYSADHLEKAKSAAIKSSVLLKNANILPLNKSTKIALIGPLADAPHEQLGTWTFDGDKTKTQTPLNSFLKNNITVNYASGLTYSRDKSTKGFTEAINKANASDVIVFIGGEEAILSGEAHSRANIDLPGAQEQLIKELAKTGKPIVLIIMAGRPITISNIINDVDAVLMAWHPGTMGGPALHDMVFGISEPTGRLPVTWPKTAAQYPLFYNHKNTGRPADPLNFVQMDNIPIEALQSSLGNTSHYLDIGYLPEFPFGYGLGYTKFKYDNLQISKNTIGLNETLEVKVDITNTGEKEGDDLVQLYIQDVVGSITRPVKELKNFKRVHLKKGEKQEVVFTISPENLKFVNQELENKVEPGSFNVFVGSNAADVLQTSFVLTDKK